MQLDQELIRQDLSWEVEVGVCRTGVTARLVDECRLLYCVVGALEPRARSIVLCCAVLVHVSEQEQRYS